MQRTPCIYKVCPDILIARGVRVHARDSRMLFAGNRAVSRNLVIPKQCQEFLLIPASVHMSRSDIQLSGQQFCHICPDGCRPVALPLARRTFLKWANQQVHIRSSLVFSRGGEDPLMECHFTVFVLGRHQRAIQSQCRSLRNISVSESHKILKKTI